MQYLKNIFILYGVIIILFLSTVGLGIYIYLNSKDCPIIEPISNQEQMSFNDYEENDLPNHIFVDIKGYINNPGVYELEEGSIVNDLITLAGGLKKNGTTDNINLSKRLVDESTLTILSTTELSKREATTCKTEEANIESSSNSSSSLFYESSPTSYEVNENSNSSNTSNNISSKVSLNTATKEQLMTLSGVGEKTAEKIIEYRNTKKFETIEDIKNVSGIGDSIFEKIKDNITV